MNDHNRTQVLEGEIFDGTSETQTQFVELYILSDEKPQLKAGTKDILFVSDLEYPRNSVIRQLKNFQEWKLRLTDKNSLHFGISFFI
ncbi:hypothetical protein [Chryseobacterium sp. POE27]|jgi:hypothetical protein|uniref:hypothetical protein n=1 Tax=Chryseobacterium sp. POE27 TaxID=3138177 RepID=UPI003219D096